MKDFTKTKLYRDRIKRSNNCLVWTGRIRTNNWSTSPLITIEGVTYYVRRLVTGAQRGERVYRTCTNLKCVRRSHLRAIPPALKGSIPGLKSGGQVRRTHCDCGEKIHERVPKASSASSRVVRYCPACTGRLTIAERRARRKNKQATRVRRVPVSGEN